MTEPVTNPQTPEARAGDAAARRVETTVQGVADAAQRGIATAADAGGDFMKKWGDAIKKDGFFKGTWNFFSTLGANTAEGGLNFFGKFFQGTNHGGWIGGLLGVAGAWLAGQMFGGGIMGTIAMALLIPAGFLMGRSFGNDNINPMLSNMFGGNRREGAAPSRAPAAPTVTTPAPGQTTSVAPAAPGAPGAVVTTTTTTPAPVPPAAVAGVTPPPGVSYSPTGPFALVGSPSDQQLGTVITSMTVMAKVNNTFIGTPVTVTPANIPTGPIANPTGPIAGATAIRQ